MHAYRNEPYSKTKKRFTIILGIVNYLNRYSPSDGEICEPLERLASVKVDWTWTRHMSYAIKPNLSI